MTKPARERTTWSYKDGSGSQSVTTDYLKGPDFSTANNNWSGGHKEARTVHPDGSIHHKTNHGKGSKYTRYDK